MDKCLGDDVHDPMLIRIEAGAKLGRVQLPSLAVLLIKDLLFTLAESGGLAILHKLLEGLLRRVIDVDGQLDLEAMLLLAGVIADGERILLLSSGIARGANVDAAADGEDDFAGLAGKSRVDSVKETFSVRAVTCGVRGHHCFFFFSEQTAWTRK